MMLNGLILNKETLVDFKEDTDISIIKCLSASWIDFPIRHKGSVRKTDFIYLS